MIEDFLTILFAVVLAINLSVLLWLYVFDLVLKGKI